MNLTQVPISMIDTVAGDAGKVLTSDGSTLSWTASSVIAPTTGIVAWVNFDGTKDTTGAASTANTNRLIRASSNVTSVLRNAAGDYTVNFTSALVDANYCLTGSTLRPSSGVSVNAAYHVQTGVKGTSTCRIYATAYDGSLFDNSDVNACIIR